MASMNKNDTPNTTDNKGKGGGTGSSIRQAQRNILKDDNIFPDIDVPPPPPPRTKSTTTTTTTMPCGTTSTTTTKTTGTTTTTVTTTLIPAPVSKNNNNSSSGSSGTKSLFPSLPSSPFPSLKMTSSSRRLQQQQHQQQQQRQRQQQQQQGRKSLQQQQQSKSLTRWSHSNKSLVTTKQSQTTQTKREASTKKCSLTTHAKQHSQRTLTKRKEYPLPSHVYLRNYLPPIIFPPSPLLLLMNGDDCDHDEDHDEEEKREEFLSLSLRQKRKIGDAFDRMNTPVLLQIVLPASDDDDEEEEEEEKKDGGEAVGSKEGDKTTQNGSDQGGAKDIKGKNGKEEKEEDTKNLQDTNTDINDNNNNDIPPQKDEQTKKQTDKNNDANNNKHSKKNKKQDMILYSETNTKTASSSSSRSSSTRIPLHPHWDHLNEQVSIFNDKPHDFPFVDGVKNGIHKQSGRSDEKKKVDEGLYEKECKKEKEGKEEKEEENKKKKSWDDVYQTLKIRLVIDSASSLLQRADKKNLKRLESSSSSATTKEEERSVVDPMILTEIPLHPTQLRCLPNSNNSSSNTSLLSNATASIIPKSLPPNSIVIQYTDDSLRVHPDLYRLLLSKNIIQECQFDENIQEDIMAENRRTRRFDDDVFAVLDGGGGGEEEEEGEIVPLPSPMVSPSRLLVGGSCDDESHVQNKKSVHDTTTNGTTSNGGGGGGDDASALSIMSSTVKDDVFDLLGKSTFGSDSNEKRKQGLDTTSGLDKHKNDATTTTMTNNGIHPSTVASSTNIKSTESNDNKENQLQKSKSNDKDPILSDQKSKLRKQVEMLQNMLKMEEEALEVDKNILCREMNELKLSLKQEQEIETETAEIKTETSKELENFAKAEFILEARRVKLLRDLRQIYPIRAFPDNTFAIRGIKVPTDILDPTVPDDVISAALGFACHLVFMCSKYLSIPLRYRLICNSSRSAVQDDGNSVLPLFKERVIDLKQLEKAVILLTLNIECLLYTRGISFSPLWHMLAKLDQLFERTTKGGPVDK